MLILATPVLLSTTAHAEESFNCGTIFSLLNDVAAKTAELEIRQQLTDFLKGYEIEINNLGYPVQSTHLPEVDVLEYSRQYLRFPFRPDISRWLALSFEGPAEEDRVN